MLKRMAVFLLVMVGFAISQVFAAEDKTAKDITQPRGEGEFIFTAPPRESPDEALRTYKPIAEYLSRATGKNIVYRWPRTWGLYRAKMLAGDVDLAFDGPHLNGWRVKNLNHHMLAKISAMREFSIITKKGAGVKAVADLKGQLICTQPPPNLGGLIITSQFQTSGAPLIVPTKSWQDVYNGVMAGKCQAGVLPSPTLQELDQGRAFVLQQTKPLPDQAFSASDRFTEVDRAKLRSALLAAEAAVPTERLRARFQGR